VRTVACGCGRRNSTRTKPPAGQHNVIYREAQCDVKTKIPITALHAAGCNHTGYYA
jgi:hypothetical protein